MQETIRKIQEALEKAIGKGIAFPKLGPDAATPPAANRRPQLARFTKHRGSKVPMRLRKSRRRARNAMAKRSRVANRG
jgi:hypothetical protein